MTNQTPEEAVDEVEEYINVPFGTTMRRTLEGLIEVLDERYKTE